MSNGDGRLLQGEDRIEVGKGVWHFYHVDGDNRRGSIKVDAPPFARLNPETSIGVRDNLVLETNAGERFDLVTVRSVGYFDKNASDIAYNRWRGDPRTEITVEFTLATKQKNWRPVLLKHGVP